jgi:DNA-binding NarL/FixJ family response regulator
MIPPRERPRVVVRAADRRLRELIAERLSALGDLDVAQAEEAAPRGAEASVEDAGDGSPLTPRETEVLGLLARGLANKEIAASLGMSVHTAKFHVESVLRKLSASNRAEAVMAGVRRGLLGV